MKSDLNKRIFLWISFPMLFQVFRPLQITVSGACTLSEVILPCRCSLSNADEAMQVWCSHSSLSQILVGIRAIENISKIPIDELVLENNNLPALPARFFGSLKIERLMLRYNNIERVSGGWLNGLEKGLLEVYIVEPYLRSIPVDSFNGMVSLTAITIESVSLKHLPNLSGLLHLTYINLISDSTVELKPGWFQHMPKLQRLQIHGGLNTSRLDKELFKSLPSLETLELTHTSIQKTHLRAFKGLSNLLNLKLSFNQIDDSRMVGHTIKDIPQLKHLRLDHNNIKIITKGSFVDHSTLTEVHLNGNHISEIQYGAFVHTPLLKTLFLQDNQIEVIQLEAFLQTSKNGVQTIYLNNNKISNIVEVRSLINSLPTLKLLDISNNYLDSIPFGVIGGHSSLEQWNLNSNGLNSIGQGALRNMPALRELRLHNNSLSHKLLKPFWDLPNLKGLDLSMNTFKKVDFSLLVGLPSLRNLDLSRNNLSKIDSIAFLHNPFLETLNLSVNSIVELHNATFRHLNYLFEVDMSFNQLFEIGFTLPKSLERISLKGNMLTALSNEKSLKLPNMRMFDLSYNRFEHLPSRGFQGFPHLRILSLGNNNIQVLEKYSFNGVTSLEMLHLQNNNISRIEDDVFSFMPNLLYLNLQGNSLQKIQNHMFAQNHRLKNLDLSQNKIHNIFALAFKGTRLIEYLDLSENNLNDTPKSLACLHKLRDIDLSNNRISRIQSDTVSGWPDIEEIRLSNNIIKELKHKTFNNLTNLHFLDISSNDILVIEFKTFDNLPALQELALANNKIVEIIDNTLENVPKLSALHFQYNNMRRISEKAIINSPNLVFVNLSYNAFCEMTNIGLQNIRTLEVLDLSSNYIGKVSTMPLKELHWLVELKMDNNRIYDIRGSPFETMPRLRFLTLRNNRLSIIHKEVFQTVRDNIAVIDIYNNPIECSCRMHWLLVWLHARNYPLPGLKCRNGSLLQEFSVKSGLCSNSVSNNQYLKNVRPIQIHNDVEKSTLNNKDDVLKLHQDECELHKEKSGHQLLYGYVKNSNTKSANHLSLQTSENDFSAFPPIGFKNTIFNIREYEKQPDFYRISLNYLPSSSAELKSHNLLSTPFTIFGYPIPNLVFGQFSSNEKVNVKGRNLLPAQRHEKHRPSQKMISQLAKCSSSNEFYKKQNSSRNLFYTAKKCNQTFTPKNSTVRLSTSFKGPVSLEQGGFIPIFTENMVEKHISEVQYQLPQIYMKNSSIIKLKTTMLPTYSNFAKGFQTALPTSKIINFADASEENDHRIKETRSLSNHVSKNMSTSIEISFATPSLDVIHPTSYFKSSTPKIILLIPPPVKKEVSNKVVLLSSFLNNQFPEALTKHLITKGDLYSQKTAEIIIPQISLSRISSGFTEHYKGPTLFKETFDTEQNVSDREDQVQDSENINADIFEPAHQNDNINWHFNVFNTQRKDKIYPLSKGYSRHSAAKQKDILIVTKFFSALIFSMCY